MAISYLAIHYNPTYRNSPTPYRNPTAGYPTEPILFKMNISTLLREGIFCVMPD